LTAEGVGSENILLVRTSALGDLAQALPALVAVRRARPHARLGWVVDEAFAPLLEGHELLDEVLTLPLRRWRRGGAGRHRDLIRFLRRLRRFRADVALDLMGNHKGALIALASGARRRLGLRRADRREPSSALWLTSTVAARGAHAVERALSVAAALVGWEPTVDFAPAALACGRDRVPPGDYVYLHPGAAWGNKRYPPASWGQVAAQVGGATGLEVRVGAAPGETELAEQVVAAGGAGTVRLDAPTLADLVGAIRGARLVLAGDTGAAHLARAFDRPVVAVHGPTDPARHGPWGRLEAAVFHALPCSFCHQRMDAAKPCLLAIPPAAVAARARAVLGDGSV
jgi:heptosyltransferase-1